MLMEQAGEVVVAMLESELVELYIMQFFPVSFGWSAKNSFFINWNLKFVPQDSPIRSSFTLVTSTGSGSNFVKSMSHAASSRFRNRMRFCAEIFSFANRSISCSYSRSFRFRNCKGIAWEFWVIGRRLRTHLNVSDCRAQDGEIRRLLLVRCYR